MLRDLDQILMPGITHWQSPRYFAYFATTAAEPGILAELLIAGLNQVGILWRASPALQELEEVTLDWLRQLLGLPEPLHGHIEDTASSGLITALAAARAAAPDRKVVVCSEHTHSSTIKAARLLELEVRATPVDAAYALRADALDLTDACAVVATVGTTSSTAVDPVAAIADRAAAAGTWLHVDAAYAGAAAVCPELRHHFAGWERADSIGVQPAQVAVHADGLLGVLLPAPRRPAARVQPRARVPARERGRGQPERVRLAARPPLPGAEAVGDAALLRPRGPAGDHPRARAAGGALRAVGRRRAGLGALRPAALLARLLPAGSAATTENAAIMERVNDSGQIFLSHTKLDDRFVLRLAIGNARTSEADVALAWDVLREAAAAG